MDSGFVIKSIRIPGTVWERLSAVALEKGRSVSEVITDILTEAAK